MGVTPQPSEIKQPDRAKHRAHHPRMSRDCSQSWIASTDPESLWDAELSWPRTSWAALIGSGVIGAAPMRSMTLRSCR